MFLKQPRSSREELAARPTKQRNTGCMEVTQVLDRPASQSFYEVAGRLLFVESTDLRLANLVERLFAGWQLTPVVSPERSPDIRIKFFCSDSPPKIPHNLDRFEIAEGGKCFTDGADVYLAFGTSLVHLHDGNPTTVSVSVPGWPDAGDPVLARLASFAVFAALRRYGLFDIHSAGMVNPDSGKAVLIIGPSGSGKSTLALQLATAGWPHLSDDAMLLSLADGGVEARGFRSFFAVRDELNDRFKTCFEPASQRMVSAVPGLLLFISLSGEQKTEFKPLAQAQTMVRLIRACPWATYDTSIAVANLEVLSRLARKTRAFEFLAGRDLLEPNYAADLLSQR
jgi:hypothetical protein